MTNRYHADRADENISAITTDIILDFLKNRSLTPSDAEKIISEVRMITLPTSEKKVPADISTNDSKEENE